MLLRRCGQNAPGLRLCEFETAAVDDRVVEALDLEEIGMHAVFEEYDCRLNRLAQLPSPSRTASPLLGVAAARDRYGAGRTGALHRHEHRILENRACLPAARSADRRPSRQLPLPRDAEHLLARRLHRPPSA